MQPLRLLLVVFGGVMPVRHFSGAQDSDDDSKGGDDSEGDNGKEMRTGKEE